MRKILLLGCAAALLLSANASAEIQLNSLAKKKWTLVESDNFKIITDISPDKAKLMTEQLEKYRAFCELWLNAKPQEDAAKMVIFMTKKPSTWKAFGISRDWIRITASHEIGSESQMFVNVKGLFGANYRNSFQRANSGRATVLDGIAQELFNQVGVGSKYPLWFKTGFGLYLATYAESDQNIILGSLEAHRNRFSSIKRLSGSIVRYNVKELFSRKKMNDISANKSKKIRMRDFNRFYMQSFLATHYFYSSDALSQQMFHYIKRVVAGETEESAVRLAFSKSFEELEKDLHSYARSSSMVARVMKKQEIDSLLILPASYEVSIIDEAQFFDYYAKALQGISDEYISCSDKQAFFNEYNQRFALGECT